MIVDDYVIASTIVVYTCDSIASKGKLIYSFSLFFGENWWKQVNHCVNSSHPFLQESIGQLFIFHAHFKSNDTW
ncbi:hypothetical protein JHK82_047042 [Glycine max]|uniref:Uncharacterized protein n=2 Tax=Glycine subgen. Soja TaxID=1462606 RepID=K7MKT4_SOYBN|nr:hypothetical protein JHK86_046934 [Glycine max]KAG4932730.1 hypothetical protein JHK87_046732 [Glycine soja]KAG4942858.1 hypothetical protein JHK85_047504 [Glycine max]KAG5097188.1 hypothetical protein JHK82_047042 [Glycine max]KAG5101976.1 hypothetical protein JHK84_046945 [Glycine max]